MRAVVQRVSRADVRVDGSVTGRIERGFVVLLGVREGDGEDEARYIADKVANLRIFPDDDAKMNRSVLDTGGEILLISQFTLHADTRRGRRPSFVEAAKPDVAEPLVERVAQLLEAAGLTVAQGVFGASMDVTLTNEGPVTIIIDSPASSGHGSRV